VAPFTSFPGLETAPSFSPDGSQVVFAWSPEGAGGFDLYVKVLGSEKTLRLTNQPAEGLFPAWSPDGRQIAFARWGRQGRGIYLVPALGGAERKVADPRLMDYSLRGLLSWSPDARRLAYSDGSIVVLDVATLQKHEVGRPSSDCQWNWVPAFSPDGRRLAFACMLSYGVNALYVMALPGGSVRQVALIHGDFMGLAWAGEGRHVLFASDGELWRVDAGGGEPVKLLSGRDLSLPAVSRGGERLAYAQEIANVNLWRLPLPGPGQSAGPPVKVVSSSRVQVQPAYSPDGRGLAFVSDRSGTDEVWISNVDGSDPRPLTSFGGPWTGSPSWSPDGRQVALDSRASGESAIYVVRVDGGLPQRVATGLPDSATPWWSRDGTRLYFSARAEGTEQIFAIRLDDGEVTQVTHQGGSAPRESADGRRIYYIRPSEGRSEVCSVAGKGGGERPVAGMPRLRGRRDDARAGARRRARHEPRRRRARARAPRHLEAAGARRPAADLHPRLPRRGTAVDRRGVGARAPDACRR
jgi:Tol biopolymer transport system component